MHYTGVSTKTICVSPSVVTPTVLIRVVWLLADTADTLRRIKMFINILLPALGVPMMATDKDTHFV